jgi:hypothetical protein
LVFFDGEALVAKSSPSMELLRDVHGCDATHAWAVGFQGTILQYVP